MKTKHEIGLEWPDDARFWVLGKNGDGSFWNTDPRRYDWWDDDRYMLVEHPKPELRYRMRASGSTFATVYDGPRDTDIHAHFYGPDAERHAHEFADMLNASDIATPSVFCIGDEWSVTDGHDYEVVAMRGIEAEQAARAYAAVRGTAPSKWAQASANNEA